MITYISRNVDFLKILIQNALWVLCWISTGADWSVITVDYSWIEENVVLLSNHFCTSDLVLYVYNGYLSKHTSFSVLSCSCREMRSLHCSIFLIGCQNLWNLYMKKDHQLKKSLRSRALQLFKRVLPSRTLNWYCLLFRINTTWLLFSFTPCKLAFQFSCRTSSEM